MLKSTVVVKLCSVLFSVLISAVSFAQNSPVCLSKDQQPLPVMNSQVIQWKSSTPNQFQARARVLGSLRQVYTDHSGHKHLSITIGPNTGETLEVIYNEDFGRFPQMTLGMQIEACGDYITSTAQSGPYPPSPDGAIIHWVHMSPNTQRHPSGYVIVAGQLVGQSIDSAGPKQYPNRHGRR